MNGSAQFGFQSWVRVAARRVAVLACLWLGLAQGSFAEGIVLEAENGALVGVWTSTAVSGYSGTGYVTGFSDGTDRVRWSFEAEAGVYWMEIRYRSPYGYKEYGGSINGVGLSGPLEGATTFTVLNHGYVELVPGLNELEIGGGWSYYEIDRVDLTPATPVPPLPVPATLSDSQATLAARVLMADLAADYGALTWTGQQQPEEVPAIVAASGERPAIISGDLMDYSPSRIERGLNPGNHTEAMIALEDDGYAISFCWHWNAPTNLIDTPDHEWWRGFYTHATTFDVEAALANTNSNEYALLLRDIDAIAAELGKVADAGIPVLWRPLHEAEGGWFWWGARGPEPFKQLWQLLYHRLTVEHELHHMIWVLTSEDPAWYPGHEVVDIIGVDAYPNDHDDPLSPRWEALKPRFDGLKLVALTEFGGVPDIERMHRLGAWWAYFASWGGNLGPGAEPASRVAAAYQSTEVLTLDGANARPPAFVGCTLSPDGSLELRGKGPRGAPWTLLGSANPAATTQDWSQIESGTFVGGILESDVSVGTNPPHQFFRIQRP